MANNPAEEKIAIVGMACRFSGGATNPSKLWDMLKEGRTGFAPLSEQAHRFNAKAWYHPQAKRLESLAVKGGYPLAEDEREFDPTFFGIRPKEAAVMDPQQRQILEVVFECMESAGVAMDKLAGTDTGVFVGNYLNNHLDTMAKDPTDLQDTQWSGKLATLISNRVSYCFDLQGPSVTLDTACSSSLYGLNIAIQSILSGECSSAFVGGTNLTTNIESWIDAAHGGLLSPCGKSQTYDAAADGYGKGDGIGALLIKKLDDAIRDNDPIRAIIMGSATNSCGRTHGIGHPGLDGQERVIRQAYRVAGNLDPLDTQYLECHGTGTKMGDPLEIVASSRVFSQGRTSDTKLVIGSTKPTLGHTEATSGIASIIKTVLALERGVIPPTPGIKTLNPESAYFHQYLHVDFEGSHFNMTVEKMAWPPAPVRRASVNSFGYGGSNAHAILEYRPSLAGNYYYADQVEGSRSIKATSEVRKSSQESHLLVFSAHTEAVLGEYLEGFFARAHHYRPQDLAYTLGTRRTHHRYRAYTIIEGPTPSSVPIATMTKGKREKQSDLVFVFTGQGAQWPQMGMKLFSTYAAFRDTILKLDITLQLLSKPPSWKLADILKDSTHTYEINDPTISQPICTAVQLALVALLKTWGIVPRFVVGHSSGEIAAAATANYISNDDAIVLAYSRGVAVSDTRTMKGAMMAVGMTEEEFLQAVRLAPLQKLQQLLTIACYNSPQSLTISGPERAIDALGKELGNRNVFHRKLKTGGRAYHSPAMHSVGDKYELMCWNALEELREQAEGADAQKLPRLHMFSTVTGTWIDKDAKLTPRYWRSNLESPVRFQQAIELFFRLGMMLQWSAENTMFVEIGPHPALGGPIRQIQSDSRYLSTLSRGSSDTHCLLNLVGSLHNTGFPVDFGAVTQTEISSTEPRPKVIVDLPSYKWDHKTLHWWEPRASLERRHRTHPRHDLLGSQVPGTTSNPRLWRNVIDAKDTPWLAHHKVGSQIVVPAVGYLAMAVEAATQIHQERRAQGLDLTARAITGYSIEDLVVKNALVVPDEGRAESLFELSKYQVTTKTDSTRSFEFKISSVLGGSHQENASGRITLEFDRSSVESLGVQLQPSEILNVESGLWYKRFTEGGLNYTSSFRALSAIHASPGAATASIKMNSPETEGSYESRYALHPAAMDLTLQLSIIATCSGLTRNLTNSYLPVSAERIFIKAPNNENKVGRGFARGRKAGFKATYADVELLDSNGDVLFQVRQLRCVKTSIHSAPTEKLPHYRELWKQDASLLTAQQWETLFPYGIPKPGRDIYDSLETTAELTSLIVVQSVEDLQEIVGTPGVFSKPDTAHLINFWNWIKRVNGQVRCNPSYVHLDSTERKQLIRKLESQLRDQGCKESLLVNQIYENLQSIFTGNTRAIEVLNVGGYWDGFFNDSASHTGGYAQIRNVADVLGHHRPGMKILEIGAGTAGCTKVVLKTLGGDTKSSIPFRRYSSYTFTDISAGFFHTQKEALAEYPGIEYKVLDIERDPLGQGFENGTYDLIVAGNVIHATQDVEQSLRHIKHLLKPDGFLLLMENSVELPFASYIVGGLPGWWRSKDVEESLSPLKNDAAWKKTLGNCGFTDISVFEDYPESIKCMTTFLARPNKPSSNRSLGVTGIPSVAITESGSEDGTRHNGTNSTNEHEILRVYQDDTYSHSSASSVQSPETPNTEAMADVIFVYKDSSSSASSASSTRMMEQAAAHYELRLCSMSLAEAAQKDLESSRFIFADGWNEAPILTSLTEEDLQDLQQVISKATSLVWVTAGGLLQAEQPEHATAIGFVRTLRMEFPSLKLNVLDLSKETVRSSNFSELILRVFTTHTESRAEPDDLAEKDGVLYSARIAPAWDYNAECAIPSSADMQMVPYNEITEPTRLDIGTPGLFDTLFFRRDPIFAKPPKGDMVDIQAHVAGMNMKDILNLMGNLDLDSLCFEGAGVVTAVGPDVTHLEVGDRVVTCCLSPYHYGTMIRTEEYSCIKLLDDEAFEEVIALPVQYGTAVYSLINVARLRKNQSVLIHAAAGGVGLAAIQVAQMIGAKVFATVGNDQKKQYLMEKCGIPEDHIFNSRNDSFYDGVMKATKGKGVDVTLSSVVGELLHKTFACLGRLGTHVEIGQRDLWDHGKFDMNMFIGGKNFAHVDLTMLYDNGDVTLLFELLNDVMSLYREGKIKPINITSYHITEIGDAIRYFAEGKHTGKIIIDYTQKTGSLKVQRSKRQLQLSSDAAYILLGGLGGLGRSLGLHMVRSGARELVFLSRSGERGREEYLGHLRSLGATVHVVAGDASNRDDVLYAFAAANKPVKGVVHSALILRDKLFANMKLPDMQDVIRSKVVSAQILHDITKTMPDLEFFVTMSSTSGVLGTVSQSSYAAANYYLDTLARHRRSLGLPATSVPLGRVSGIGFAAENENVQNFLSSQGFYAIETDEFLDMMDRAIMDSRRSTTPTAEIALTNTDAVLLTSLDPGYLAHLTADPLGAYPWLRRDARFGLISNAMLTRSGGAAKKETSAKSLANLVQEAAGENRAAAQLVLQNGFLDAFARILAISVDEVELGKSGAQYGLDSMSASEMKIWVYEELSLDLPLFKLLNPGYTLGNLVMMVFEAFMVGKSVV